MSETWTNKYLFKNWDSRSFNCWTLVCDVYLERLGIEIDRADWLLPNDPNSLRDMTLSQVQLPCWLTSEGKEMDVVAMGGSSRLISHTGILLGGNRVLHINQNTMGRIDPLSRIKEKFRTIQFYSHASNRNS